MHKTMFSVAFLWVCLAATIAQGAGMPTISSSNDKIFQAWRVMKMTEGGQQYVNLATPLGNGASVFRIHLNPGGPVRYTISMNDPRVTYPESVTQAQALVQVGGTQHYAEVANYFNGPWIISYLNLAQDFVNQLKGQSSFTIAFPVGAPFHISLTGFNDALKYAKKLEKTIK